MHADLCIIGSLANQQECTDPCCNATTCHLAAGAQCNGGACCSNCRFLSYGTTCRASNGECDVAEVCSGCSSQCPVDQLAQDGTSCGSGTGFCYNGSCPTRDSQCKAFYGSGVWQQNKIANELFIHIKCVRVCVCVG